MVLNRVVSHRAVSFVVPAVFAVLCLLHSTVTTLSAQSFYGSILGVVSDSGGAIVPGVDVRSTNIATSASQTVQTDNAGEYRLVNLIPGSYRLDFQKPSFQHVTRTDVVVTVQSAVRVDVALSVGEVTQTLEVKAEPLLLQTENTSLGHVIQQPQNMPLNGRNVFSLAALVPGVVAQGQATSNPSNVNNTSRGNFQINGGLSNANAWFIDGAPINVGFVSMVALVPTQDVIQEFKVDTNAQSAEFGRFTGGVINLTTRSGGNSFHGAAYEYLRNDKLNANNFFSNKGGLAVPAYKQNQFGARIGGPVIKEKVFFFGSYEGWRQRQAGTNVATIPTAAMLRGDFSGIEQRIYDPLTTCGTLGNAPCLTDANGNSIYTRQQFANNIVPQSRLDRTAQALAPLIWPSPNQPGLVNNFVTNFSGGANNDQVNGRVDWNASDKQRLFARYTFWGVERLAIQPLGVTTNAPIHERSQQIVLADTYAFNPTTVLDARVGFIRYNFRQNMATLGIDLTQVGWPSSFNEAMPLHTLPFPIIAGFSGYDGSQVSIIRQSNQTTSFAASLTKVAGPHTIKSGVEIRKLYLAHAQSNNSAGQYRFNNAFTAINPNAPAGTGSSFASYMLGYGASGDIWIPNPVTGLQWYNAFYVNDIFRVNSRLTLTAGVRWDVPFAWTEKHDRLTVLQPDAVNLLAEPTGLPLKGALALVNSTARPERNSFDNRYYQFQPRLGIAYRPVERTVLRAGYALVWLPSDIQMGASPSSSPVNSARPQWVPTLDGGLTPFATLNNPWSQGLFYPLGHDPAINKQVLGQTANGVLPSQSYGYMQSWNFNVQRELSSGTVLELGYAGSRGTHLPNGQTLNQLPDQYLSMGTRLQELVPNPFFGRIESGPLATPTIQRGQLLRPFPAFSAIGQIGRDNGDTIYHGMQVKFQKQFQSAGTILASYTWSKWITTIETQTPWNEGNVGNVVAGIQNFNDIRGSRSVSSNDVPHNLVVSYQIDLPFGHGRRFLSGVSGIADKLVSGWGFNGISSFSSGLPLVVTNAANNSNAYGGAQRPNLVPGCDVGLSGSAQSRLNRWFNTSCFLQPAPFTFGNAPRNFTNIRSGGINNWDVSFFKTMKLTEELNLQFRAEFFNLFNRVQFGNPGLTFGAGNFGVVSSQFNNPRLVQFALRLDF